VATASRDFQIFTKPIGPICNLDCHYCYYLQKEDLYPQDESFRMSDDVLEDYIVQHIEVSPGTAINFFWHGGEPTILGLDYFRKIVALQHKHQPPGRRITNGIQTNGMLLDEAWCRLFAEEKFSVGISLDGPAELHDQYRVTKGQKPSHAQVMQGYKLLLKHRVPCDILCVVHEQNVQHPRSVYRFFKDIKAQYISFIPLVEMHFGIEHGVGPRSVPAAAFGEFLCTIFDEWVRQDIGTIMVQIFEECIMHARGQGHALCLFRPTCGDVPVVEHNGDFYSCDHFVNPQHHLGNIRERPLFDMLESPEQRAFGQYKQDSLPQYCRECDVLDMCNGGCPKDRIIDTPDGEPGLNYLCAGYKRFFSHCRPYATQLAALWHSGEPAEKLMQMLQVEAMQSRPKVGRNDPCPCGSGRKYKRCCLLVGR